MKKQTKEEAYALLNQAISQINTNRETHVALQQALEVLKEGDVKTK